jgi:hypothetical protein
MGKGSRSSRLVTLVLSQALLVLPASAQTLPPNFINPNVPHDVPAGSAATVAQLAVFAWQEFIALNWIAMNPATTSLRGRANGLLNPNAGFLGAAPDGNGNFPLVVWQTYRHKNELFPADGNTATTYDSKAPTYKYQSPAPTAAAGGPIPAFNLFNNLDETSQIGLDFMYAHATSAVQPPITGPGSPTGVRVAYEVKLNRAVFNYAIKPGNPSLALTNPNNNYHNLFNALDSTGANLGTYGGSCTTPTDPSVIQLPCGDNTKPGDLGEGAIEIKAAWRKLDPTKDTISHFFTRNVIFYTGPPGSQKYNNAVWGLVALHIIHKTKSFPAFVFATWEQAEEYNGPPTDPDYLAFQNLTTKSGLLPNIPVTRAHAIHSQVAATNTVVHAAFTAQNPSTIWQWYKLVGVQATPTNQPPATAPADAFSTFFLANIMVETNQTLQNFVGGAPAGMVIPGIPNVYLSSAGAQSPFTMGGCQGCHGFQGQDAGGDMSVVIARGQSFAASPDSLDSSAPTAIKMFNQRMKNLLTLKSKLPGKGTTSGGR